ncbi:hypothetical protein Tco_0103627 [Tanacetum coccineum]
MEASLCGMGRAFDKCQLGDEVRSKEGKLDSPERGSKQLRIAWAVVLLKKQSIGLLTSSASVDTTTDGMIQGICFNHDILSIVSKDISKLIRSIRTSYFEFLISVNGCGVSDPYNVVSSRAMESKHKISANSQLYSEGNIHIYEAKKERSSKKDKKHTELPSTPEMENALDYEGTAITPSNEPEKLQVLAPESQWTKPFKW